MTRGRQSNARNKLVAIPPPDMSVLGEAEAAVWTQVCAQQDSTWLETGPGPLLETYCYAVVQLRLAQTELRMARVDPDTTAKDKAKACDTCMVTMERLSPLVERLSRHLRLTPQSRLRADKTGNSPLSALNNGDMDDEDETG